jgi:glycosyltransferase involved in cell wall biosynthesis
VTIITVVLNGEKYLERTIQSVASQTYENVEYVIIDGGSTDGTVDIIKKYESVIDHWISEPDHGIYNAMNKGIDLARGEWVNFLGAGDCFYERTTLETVFLREWHDIAMLYGDHQIVYEGSLSEIQKAGDVKSLWQGMVFAHASLFSKTHLMKEYSFDTAYRISSDYDFIYKVYRNRYRFAYANQVISCVLGEGQSDRNRFLALKESWTIGRLRCGFRLKLHVYYALRGIYFLTLVSCRKLLPSATIYLLQLRINYRNSIASPRQIKTVERGQC